MCLAEPIWAEKLQWLELRTETLKFVNDIYNPEHRKRGYRNNLEQSCHLKTRMAQKFETAHQNASVKTTQVAAKFRIEK